MQPARLERPARPYRHSSFEIAVIEWWRNGWCAIAAAFAAFMLAGTASAATAWLLEYPRAYSWHNVLSIAVSASFVTWVMVLVFMALSRNRARGA